MNTVSKTQNHYESRNLIKPEYIVAIGGSAGFLYPLLKFFDHVKSDDISYVVLRHVGRDVKSELAHIVRMHSALKITDVHHDMKVEKNTVYILPPGFYMTITNGHLHLHSRTGLANCAIDIFMESLAKDYKEKSIAVVLSGSGSNGAKGVSYIKEAGGTVIAQTPSSCEFRYMPENAIKTGFVDDIALPEEMPGIIKDYIESRPYQARV